MNSYFPEYSPLHSRLINILRRPLKFYIHSRTPLTIKFSRVNIANNTWAALQILKSHLVFMQKKKKKKSTQHPLHISSSVLAFSLTPSSQAHLMLICSYANLKRTSIKNNFSTIKEDYQWSTFLQLEDICSYFDYC